MNSSKINCVIVEDEEHNTRLMESYVSQIDELELLGSFITAVDLLNFNRLPQVQIIYLDIQMPGMTGVDFLKAKPIDAEVIFTTAYSEYALEGYELSITDYLLKPVELPRFIQATDKAIKNIRLKQQNSLVPKEDFLMLKVDKKLVKVMVNDIVYIQSDWNYIYVHTLKFKYMVLSTMKSAESSLAVYNFIRIHKSYLVNLDHFEFLEGNLIQVSGTKLQVSRSYRSELMKVLKL